MQATNQFDMTRLTPKQLFDEHLLVAPTCWFPCLFLLDHRLVRLASGQLLELLVRGLGLAGVGYICTRCRSPKHLGEVLCRPLSLGHDGRSSRGGCSASSTWPAMFAPIQPVVARRTVGS